MEGVLFSTGNYEKTTDAIEMLLEHNCRNIWVWIKTSACADELIKEEWETNVHISHSPDINSIGDVLRELYTRNDSRDNLYIIGDVERLPGKLSIHKNYSKKHTGIILFADGNVGMNVDKGIVTKYFIESAEMLKPIKYGRALDIAFCNPSILSTFYDNFDCETFHDLLLTNPIGYTFSYQQDKRIKWLTNDKENVVKEVNDLIEELTEIIGDNVNDNTRLELNSLRLANGKMFSELIESLVVLERNDLGILMMAKNEV